MSFHITAMAAKSFLGLSLVILNEVKNLGFGARESSLRSE
jgi:hypothetical protein